jgi:hypothetical protein
VNTYIYAETRTDLFLGYNVEIEIQCEPNKY